MIRLEMVVNTWDLTHQGNLVGLTQLQTRDEAAVVLSVAACLSLSAQSSCSQVGK